MKKIFITLLLLPSLIYSHSWLHCIQYNLSAPLTVGSIQNSQCLSYPRGMNNNNIFGIDVGQDFIPSGDRACKQSPGLSQIMNKQTTYRLIWPAKNHKSDICTNPYIPDNRLQLYAYPGNMNIPDPPLSTWTRTEYLVKDFKESGVGFQNCPDFCTDPDKAPCFGDVSYKNLQLGDYKILWMWEFNVGQFYTHCYDIRLIDSNPQPSPQPTTPQPTTPQPTPQPTTPQPTPQPSPPSQCANVFGQCGGNNWKGPTCCKQVRCVAQNQYYSQCMT